MPKLIAHGRLIAAVEAVAPTILVYLLGLLRVCGLTYVPSFRV
jgi:hypothetical protein